MTYGDLRELWNPRGPASLLKEVVEGFTGVAGAG
jgi:hypothetical protein